MTTVGKTYSLEGRMLADCSCNPCTCSPCGCASYDSFVAYHIERGIIKGIDVSNVTIAKFIYNQGNSFSNNWRSVVYVDAQATSAQQEALVSAFNGELGGTLADLANLVSEVPEVKVVPMEYRINEGRGFIRIGNDAKISVQTANQCDRNIAWEYSDRNSTSNQFCFAA